MRRANRSIPEPVGAHGEGVSRARAAATTSAAAPAAAAEPGMTRALIWRLQSGGWSSIEAGNLAAIALGLRPARTGWTGTELDRLRFLRTLVTAGRIGR